MEWNKPAADKQAKDEFGYGDLGQNPLLLDGTQSKIAEEHISQLIAFLGGDRSLHMLTAYKAAHSQIFGLLCHITETLADEPPTYIPTADDWMEAGRRVSRSLEIRQAHEFT